MNWAAFGVLVLCFIGGFWVGYIMTLLANWMFKPNSQDYLLYYRMYHDVLNKNKEEDEQ